MRPLGEIPPSADRDRLEALCIALLRSGTSWPVTQWAARRALAYEIVDDVCHAVEEALCWTWHAEDMATLARFVMPQALRVEGILDAVCEDTRRTPATAGIKELATAIYGELTARKILYDNEKLSLGAPQRVSGPSEILRDSGPRRATCLETSLLFAACIEAGHGQPLIFHFVNGYGEAHALAGYWLQPPRCRQVIYQNPAVFPFKPPPNVIAVETTGITVDKRLRKAYPAACKAARAMFTKPGWSPRFAVDITEARQRGIMPWGYIGD
jgi:hypothetical protein